MPTYVFVLINHLGDPFEASELNFEDDQQAKAYAASLLAKGHPVEVRSDGQRIKLLPMMTWSVEDWLTPHLGPWPLTRSARDVRFQLGIRSRIEPARCAGCRQPLNEQTAATDDERCADCRSDDSYFGA